MCHVQQARHLADQVVFIRIKLAVGISHLPHELHHLNFLRMREAVVHQAGETKVVVGALRGLFGLHHQLHDRLVAQAKSLAQGHHGVRTLRVAGVGVRSHHVEQQHGGGQLQAGAVGGSASVVGVKKGSQQVWRVLNMVKGRVWRGC